MNMKILFIFGTRPEIIKMAPIIDHFRKDSEIDSAICFTGQHREMGKQIMDFFELTPDYDLDVMSVNQSLGKLPGTLFKVLDDVLAQGKPDLVLVQGDTATTLVGAMASYYQRVKVGHVEAGLRSYDKYSPFPEEVNRVLTSRVADYHFAPTKTARKNLLDEGIEAKKIFFVGNTVIDALFWGLEKLRKVGSDVVQGELLGIDFSKKIVLVTGHRRESFGRPFKEICEALREIAEMEDVAIVYPVHLNPNVLGPVHSTLCGRTNIHLLPPLSYPAMIYLMSKAYLVLTDSGGIQEEAPSLHKPVLVMRQLTERPEGVRSGVAKLVGTCRESIVQETRRLLADPKEYQRMANGENPYGDGAASSRIRKIVKEVLTRS